MPAATCGNKSMIDLNPRDSALMVLARSIIADDAAGALRLLAASPLLARACFEEGATRQTAQDYLDEIGRYVYAGDTALHVAAGAYRTDVVQKLIAMGADVHARNRRGAEPLHAAAVGMPGSQAWNPSAQAATIACLIRAGADPNAVDNSGVASRGAHAVRRSRESAARRRGRCPAQEQERLNAHAARDSEHRARRLRLARGQSPPAGDPAATEAARPDGIIKSLPQRHFVVAKPARHGMFVADAREDRTAANPSRRAAALSRPS
jgi:Ankyrin repeats (many copies)